MSILERIDYLQRVWRIMLPHVREPAPEDVTRWCNYPVATVEAAIFRTGQKFAATKIDLATFDARQAYRYTTGTARQMVQPGNDAASSI